MTDPIGYKDAVHMHIERFGVEPVITGASFFDGDLTVAILGAIDSGVPYVDKEVPDGVVI